MCPLAGFDKIVIIYYDINTKGRKGLLKKAKRSQINADKADIANRDLRNQRNLRKSVIYEPDTIFRRS